MSTSVIFRSAVADDVEALIDLMLVSSWGGIRAAWERARVSHETWRDRGRRELADAEGEIGFSRFVVADAGGKLAGMILLNMVGDTAAIKPMDAPEQERGALGLIRLARDSLFIREIATADWARGRGVASDLIALAEKLASASAVPRLTLIVNDTNSPAERLYLKLGYSPCAEAPSIGHPRFPDGSRLLLMEKALPTNLRG